MIIVIGYEHGIAQAGILFSAGADVTSSKQPQIEGS
jgi:hypothetical protein